MARRSSRRSVRVPKIPEPDRSEFLTDLGRLRGKACSLMATLEIKGAEYAALRKFTADVDDLVEVLTGNREHFWTPLTSV